VPLATTLVPGTLLTRLRACDFGLRQDVGLHGLLDLVHSCSRLGRQPGIQGIQLEDVVVDCAGRRPGNAIADLPKVIQRLPRAGAKFLLLRSRFRKPWGAPQSTLKPEGYAFVSRSFPRGLPR
jgi:hypothetical protein